MLAIPIQGISCKFCTHQSCLMSGGGDLPNPPHSYNRSRQINPPSGTSASPLRSQYDIEQQLGYGWNLPFVTNEEVISRGASLRVSAGSLSAVTAWIGC